MMKGDDDLLCEMLGREEEGQACSSREESRPEDAGLEAIDPPILPTMREGMLEAVQEIEEDREEDLGEIVVGLKELARELRIPILVLAQLNRAVERRANPTRLRMSDLRGSGRIEECADVIALLSRAEYYASCEDEREEKAGEAMLSVVKNRQGPIGDVPLTFHKEIMKFEDSKEDW